MDRELELEPELLTISEWPAGHRLFSQGGFHLAFDPPDGCEMPAILMRINRVSETVTVLRIASFKRDADALAWFAEQRHQRGN